MAALSYMSTNNGTGIVDTRGVRLYYRCRLALQDQHKQEVDAAPTDPGAICPVLDVGETTPRQANPHAPQGGSRGSAPAETRTPQGPTIISLDKTVPHTARLHGHHEDALHTEATLEGLLEALEPVRLDKLQVVLPPGLQLHPATTAALENLVPYKHNEEVHSLTLYTDGSFHQQTGQAGWAVTAIGNTCSGDRWLGFASGKVGLGDKVGCLTNSVDSAFEAEMDAMAFALGMAASGDGLSVTIAFDCQSAAGIAMCSYSSHTMPAHAKNFIALRVIAAQRRTAVNFKHVAAHSGDPFNECSDVLAKAAAQYTCPCDTCVSPFVKAFHENAFSHLWWTVAEGVARGQLPGLEEDGSTIPCEECLDFNGGHSTLPGVPSRLLAGGHQQEAARWNLRLATYNVTALCKQCIDMSCHRARLHLVGLQETRRFPGTKTHAAHYTRLPQQARAET